MSRLGITLSSLGCFTDVFVYRVNTLFRSLGCKVTTLTQSEVKRLGLPDSSLNSKHAVLKMPLEFPTARVKRSKR